MGASRDPSYIVASEASRQVRIMLASPVPHQRPHQSRPAFQMQVRKVLASPATNVTASNAYRTS